MEDYNRLITIAAALIGVFILFNLFQPHIWLRATLSGIRITPMEILFMKMRRVSPKDIVEAMIVTAKSGVTVHRAELEAYYLTGGSLAKVIAGLIYAKKKGIELSFQEACSLDLEDKDIIKEIAKRDTTQNTM